MIANHGQKEKYVHKIIGVNSRLDTLQAAVLNIKLRYLDQYSQKRIQYASIYDDLLTGIDEVIIPKRYSKSDHVFHQYTLIIKNNKRDKLKRHLMSKGIPSMIYYPIPLYKQDAFQKYNMKNSSLKNTEILCNSVLSLPIHTELLENEIKFISSTIKNFFMNEKSK